MPRVQHSAHTVGHDSCNVHYAVSAVAHYRGRSSPQVARALGCEDDEDMDEADDARGDADYNSSPRNDNDDDDDDDEGGEEGGNGTTDAGADTDAAEPEGQHPYNALGDASDDPSHCCRNRAPCSRG